MSGHYRNECIHGVRLGQCRCPSLNKAVHIVPCPDTKYHDDEVAQRENEMRQMAIKDYRPDGEAWD